MFCGVYAVHQNYNMYYWKTLWLLSDDLRINIAQLFNCINKDHRQITDSDATCMSTVILLCTISAWFQQWDCDGNKARTMVLARHFFQCVVWLCRQFWRLPKRVKVIVFVVLLVVYSERYGNERSVYVGRVVHHHTVSIALIGIQTVLPIMYICSRLVFGLLYPAYASYKAVKTKNVKEYVSICRGS